MMACWRWLGGAVVALAMMTGQAALACGPDSACNVEGGSYRIRLPAGVSDASPVGAIVYFHGHRSSAEATMRFKSLRDAVEELGVALIAPDGLNGSWSFPSSPRRERDEIAFVGRVLDDVLARFPIDANRIMSAGFSIGGSMSWYMACYLGERFAGHTPISGTFWWPYPASCPSPDPFISHVHGTADTVFPLTGRVIRQKYRQGDTREAIALFLERGGNRPVMEHYLDGQLACERAATSNGGEIELCLHDGGHSVRGEWIKRGWMRLAAFRGWKEFRQIAEQADDVPAP